jgi:hypothetical protein
MEEDSRRDARMMVATLDAQILVARGLLRILRLRIKIFSREAQGTAIPGRRDALMIGGVQQSRTRNPPSPWF